MIKQYRYIVTFVYVLTHPHILRPKGRGIKPSSAEDGLKLKTKGVRSMGEIENRIKEMAKEHGIPTIEAPPLARSIYRTTEIGKPIDEQFYSAVAVILAKIFKKKKVKV